MKEVVGQALGVTVEVDAERLGELVSKQVAAYLAALFPSDTAELWVALCMQAHRERQRVAAMVDIVCPHRDECPYKLDILAGIGFDDEPGDEAQPEPSLVASCEGGEVDSASGSGEEDAGDEVDQHGAG